MKLGNKIATRRKELGLTQQELADKLFVSVKTISKWETNRGNPEINLLPRIAEVLNTDIADLFDETANVDQSFTPSKRSNDFIYSCFEFAFAFLGIIFFAVTFITVEGKLPTLPFPGNFFDDFIGNSSVNYVFTGYSVLFRLSGTNVLGGLLILSIWISFLTILAHIALGVIELTIERQDIIELKNKSSYIISIVGLSAISLALLIALISSMNIGFGLILSFLLFGFILGYNIKYKKYLNK